MRNVTVTFNDGSQHQYAGVPDTVTPQDIIARAGGEFAGKAITNIDGGGTPVPEEGRTLSGTAGDVSTALQKGVVGAGQSLVGIGDIVSGGRAGKALEDAGVDLSKVQEGLSKDYSPQQQKEIEAINQAKGFTGTLGALAEHPAAAASGLLEMAPEMVAMGGIGKAAKLAKTTAGAVGIGEGAVTAGGAAEQSRELSKDKLLTGKQAMGAVGSGILTGIIGTVGNKLTTALGGNDVTGMLVGRTRAEAEKLLGETASTASGFKRVMASAFGEGVLEELPQSAQEQIWHNYANDKPLLEGVPEASAQGLALGSIAGGGLSAVQGGEKAPPAPVPATEEAIASAQEKQTQRAQGERAAAWGAPPGSKIHALLADGALHTPEGVEALENAVRDASHKVYEDVANKDIDEARKTLEMEVSKQSPDAPKPGPVVTNESAEPLAPLGDEEPVLKGQSAPAEAAPAEAAPAVEEQAAPEPEILTKEFKNKQRAVRALKESGLNPEEYVPKTSMAGVWTIVKGTPKTATPIGTETTTSDLGMHPQAYAKKLKDTYTHEELTNAVRSITGDASITPEHDAASMGIPEAVIAKAVETQNPEYKERAAQALKKIEDTHATWLETKQRLDATSLDMNMHPNTRRALKRKERAAFNEHLTAVDEHSKFIPTQTEPTWTPNTDATTSSPDVSPPTGETSAPISPSETSPPIAEQVAPTPRSAPEAPAVLPSTPLSSGTAPAPASQPTGQANRGGVPPPPGSRTAAVLASQPPPRKPPGAIARALTATREFRLKRASDYIQTMTMNSAHAYTQALRQRFNDIGLPFATVRKLLLDATTSQSVKDTSVAINGMQEGSIEYVPKMHKWTSVIKPDSLMGVHNIIKRIAGQYGEKEDATRHVFNTLMKARRILGIYAHADSIRNDVAHATPAERKAYFKLPANAHALEMATSAAMGMTQDEALEDMRLLAERPEFQEAIDMWNKVRENVIGVLVKSGRFSRAQAENYLANAEYVPFYRVMEEADPEAAFIQMSGGMGMSLTGRQKLYKMKGHTDKEVKDMLTNMEDWIVNSFSMAVRAHKARQLVDLGLDWLPDGAVEKVGSGTKGAIPIYRNGRPEHYVFDDPLFPFAFKGLESVTTPAIRLTSKPANIFRRFIILNPAFTVYQLPKDTFEAMFTSGVKHPTLLIPGAASEFLKSLVTTSKAHKALKEFSIVGIRDFSAVSARAEADTRLGINQKPQGFWGKIGHALETFSMKGDNAVRQAIYNRTLSETGDKALAIERASEVINFRKRGAGTTVDILRQTVPFLGAYFQVQSVALKTLSGQGIAPIERKKALWRLLSTSAQFYTLGLLYNALLGGDDDYQAKSDADKNSHLYIFGGSSPFSIPIRPGLFSLPFVMSNIGFKNMFDDGTNDPEKARAAFRDALLKAVATPGLLPTAVKPMVEVGFNHDPFTGREIVGDYLKNLETSEQYTPSTSEFAKILGMTGWMAPVNIDHLIKGYLGYVGTGLLSLTNVLAAQWLRLPTPDKTMLDWVRTLPGIGLGKDVPTGNITDMYALIEDVARVKGTESKEEKEARASGRVEKYAAYSRENQFLGHPAVQKQVAMIQTQLNDIRDKETQIMLAPYNETLTADRKREILHELALNKNKIVANVKQLRRAAYHGSLKNSP